MVQSNENGICCIVILLNHLTINWNIVQIVRPSYINSLVPNGGNALAVHIMVRKWLW